MKYIRIFAVLLAIGLLFAGCKENDEPQMTFPKIPYSQVGIAPTKVTYTHQGVTMELPKDFSDNTQTPSGKNYSFMYGAASMGITGEKVSKNELSEEITSLELFAADYAAALQAEALQKDGFWTVQYEDPSQNEPQMYVCAFYETEDAYWIITSYCPSQTFENYSQDMWQYVTSATFE